jgi:hypothetical protein
MPNLVQCQKTGRRRRRRRRRPQRPGFVLCCLASWNPGNRPTGAGTDREGGHLVLCRELPYYWNLTATCQSCVDDGQSFISPRNQKQETKAAPCRTGCGVCRPTTQQPMEQAGGGAANEGPPPRTGPRPLSALAQHHPPPHDRNRAWGVGRCDCTPGIFIHHTSGAPVSPATALLQVRGWLGGPVLLNYRCRSFSRSLFTSSSPLPPIPPGLSLSTPREPHTPSISPSSSHTASLFQRAFVIF